MQIFDATIAAIATPPGRGGVGIVRVSGDAVPEIALQLLGKLPAPRLAELHAFRDAGQQVIDTGIVLYFPAPNSYTGEHVLELQGHGGPVVMALLLARVVELGARLARPGEFSERAYLNDKLDLAQAEAVADLIDSGSVAAARAAQRSLQGEFSIAVIKLAQRILELRIYVEAAIDFPEEEVDFLVTPEVSGRIETILQNFAELERSAAQGQLLTDGYTIVIAGRPNAGKSSLLNALAGDEVAIVTPIPGTTRDVLRQHLQIDGLPLHIADTAGLRHSDDVVEREGVRRAHAEIARADHLLYIVDATDKEAVAAVPMELAALATNLTVTIVLNKSDLPAFASGLDISAIPTLAISARTGDGLDRLRAHLKQSAGFQPEGSGTFSARRRHRDALQRSRGHFDTARRLLLESQAGELMAEELKLAHHVLGEITGEVTSDELLGEIFASFCIGK